MKVEAVFSEGMTRVLNGAAVGDEFELSVRARIVSAEEALVEITSLGEQDPSYAQGQLEVRLLLSHPVIRPAS